VRVDEGVYEGGEISVYYDPLICKLCTHGANRQEAINRMKDALDSYVIRGVNHNIPFLRAVTENERFLKGNLSTKFIPEEFPEGFKGFTYTKAQITNLASISASLQLATIQRNWGIEDQVDHAADRTPSSADLMITIGKEEFTATVTKSKESTYVVKIGDQSLEIALNWPVESTIIKAVVNQQTHITAQLVNRLVLGYKLIYMGSETDVLVRTPKQVEYSKHMPVKAVKDTGNSLKSPMPGSVQSVAVKEGDKVVLGQEIAIVEAMKMQNVLRAPKDAIVKKVLAKPGQVVAVDEVIVEFN